VNRFLLLDLPVFLTVARHGNMTKAAALLNTVQSNVTARIKRLEDRLGATLLVRGSRKLRLTPEGGSADAIRVPRRPMHAVGTLEGVIGSVRAAGGIALLPRSYLNLVPGAYELSLIGLPEKFRTVEIFVVVQRWKLPIRLLDAFVQSCLNNQIVRDNRGLQD